MIYYKKKYLYDLKHNLNEIYDVVFFQIYQKCGQVLNEMWTWPFNASNKAV